MVWSVMSDPLGLSIGTTNLVATRVGNQPVTRRSVLTLFSHRAPEVGAPAHGQTAEPGVTLAGFVERVGDPVPLVAAINYSAGQTRSNNAVVGLNPAGELAAFVGGPAGTVHFVLDVNGYFGPNGQPGWWQQAGHAVLPTEAEEDEDLEPTFAMLETVREYAEEQLAAAGELATARRAHANAAVATARRRARPWRRHRPGGSQAHAGNRGGGSAQPGAVRAAGGG